MNHKYSILYCATALTVDSLHVRLNGPNGVQEYSINRKDRLYAADALRRDFKVPSKVKTFHGYLEKIVEISGPAVINDMSVYDWSILRISSDPDCKTHLSTFYSAIYSSANTPHHPKIPITTYFSFNIQDLHNPVFDTKPWIASSFKLFNGKARAELMNEQINLIGQGLKLSKIAEEMALKIDTAFVQTAIFEDFKKLHLFRGHPTGKPYIALGYDKEFSTSKHIWQCVSLGLAFYAHPFKEDTLVLNWGKKETGFEQDAYQLTDELNAIFSSSNICGPRGNCLTVVCN